MLETMNLIQKARHDATLLAVPTIKNNTNGPPIVAQTLGTGRMDSSSVSISRNQTTKVLHESASYLMYDSVKAIADNMASRSTPAFAPTSDAFTTFSSELEAEEEMFAQADRANGPSWFYNAAKYVTKHFGHRAESYAKDKTMEDQKFHELVVACLSGGKDVKTDSLSFTEELDLARESFISLSGGDMMEEYLVSYLPFHLIRGNILNVASEVLLDEKFILRRVNSLGCVEGTRRQLADLMDLRREVAKTVPSKSLKDTLTNDGKSLLDGPPGSPEQGGPPDLPGFDDSPSFDTAMSQENQNARIDMPMVLRDGSRRVIDAVYSVVDISSSSSDSLNMAICLSTVGEGLLKCRQARDAMLRLEEAVGIYRGLLGPYHIDVARALHSVAKALAKLGESRVALLKFAEAGRIFEACNAMRHCDSIANSECQASLFVDVGDWTKAEAKYEDVISSKQSVYGKFSIPVAKSTNEYAIVLAKHGRMNEALTQYEDARQIYDAIIVAIPTSSDPNASEADSITKCKYDVTLINLNIASIKSKKGDLQGAITSYEKGVRGLQAYRQFQADSNETTHNKSLGKHLVAAMGRIGSLKMKMGDNEGSLAVYGELIKEVTAKSPLSSRMEKAKAHIKCATIYRQNDTPEANKFAIAHLREALEMYTALYGTDHKDTKAVSSSLIQWLEEDADMQAGQS
eukprot:scaffold78493_cov50-Attheya_sp.AAC.4